MFFPITKLLWKSIGCEITVHSAKNLERCAIHNSLSFEMSQRELLTLIIPKNCRYMNLGAPNPWFTHITVSAEGGWGGNVALQLISIWSYFWSNRHRHSIDILVFIKESMTWVVLHLENLHTFAIKHHFNGHKFFVLCTLILNSSMIEINKVQLISWMCL